MVNPADLSQFAPYGDSIYGYQKSKKSNPFINAPKDDPSGGTLYFGNDIQQSDFQALMRVLGVIRYNRDPKDFAYYVAESKNPNQDQYLTQMRIVSRFGLKYLFGALSSEDYDSFSEQPGTMTELLWSFIQTECQR